MLGKGGGQNIIAIIKRPTPTAEYKMLPLSPACTVEWFIHICRHTILYPCLSYIKLLVGEGGGGIGGGGGWGGGQNIMP